MPVFWLKNPVTGEVVMDLTDRLWRVLGVMDTGTTSGSISPDGADQGDLFYFPLTTLLTQAWSDDWVPGSVAPTFTVTDTTISWVPFGISGRRANITFMYGVH